MDTKRPSIRWRALRIAGQGLEYVLVAALLLVVLEVCSRALHLGQRPMLPSVTDAEGSSRMPPLLATDISFAGGPAFEVCTDKHGLRRKGCAQSEHLAQSAILTVGDSQAFGWGLQYDETFTSLVATALGAVGAGGSAIMAAGGADVESLLPWAKELADSAPAPPRKLNILVLNLGNDLDEMYFGRASAVVPTFAGLREFMSVHSFLMLDFTLARQALAGTSWTMPPGANPVLFSLHTDEREQLALATAGAVVRLALALPPAEQTVVLILPNDYQVAQGEFDKYRHFYADAAQFEQWRTRIGKAAEALDEIEATVRDQLLARGLRVAEPLEALRKADASVMIDRSSHHFTPAGQKLLAASILQAVRL